MYTETQASRVAAPLLRKNHTIRDVCHSGSTTMLYDDDGVCVEVQSLDYIPKAFQKPTPRDIDHLDPAMLRPQSNSLYRRDQWTAARPRR
jgi:hypothetical protein